jgi:hypothetical protein
MLEHLENRVLLTSVAAEAVPAKQTSLSAATVPALFADINAANQRGGTNTITLTAPISSPYVLTAVNNTQYGATGLPVIGGKKADNLTIVGNGDTIERGGNAAAFRLFEVASNGSLTLKNLTLTGGITTVAGTSTSPIGGGAVCNFGTLVLDGVTVTGNEIDGIPGGWYPGWPYTPSYAAVGGGVWSSGSLTVRDGTLFTNNVATGPFPGPYSIPNDAMGGAIYVAEGNATITNTTITNNSEISFGGTSQGAGINIAGGIVSIDTATVANTINNFGAYDIDGSYILQSP